MIRIWNEVVEDGVAFPQEEFLTEDRNKVKYTSIDVLLPAPGTPLIPIRIEFPEYKKHQRLSDQ